MEGAWDKHEGRWRPTGGPWKPAIQLAMALGCLEAVATSLCRSYPSFLPCASNAPNRILVAQSSVETIEGLNRGAGADAQTRTASYMIDTTSRFPRIHKDFVNQYSPWPHTTYCWPCLVAARGIARRPICSPTRTQPALNADQVASPHFQVAFCLFMRASYTASYCPPLRPLCPLETQRETLRPANNQPGGRPSSCRPRPRDPTQGPAPSR